MYKTPFLSFTQLFISEKGKNMGIYVKMNREVKFFGQDIKRLEF